MKKQGSYSSLGPSFAAQLHSRQHSNSSTYGTLSRKTNLRRMSSQEKVNQITRFLLLNEDVELFRDNVAPSTQSNHARTSSDDSTNRKLSMDYLMNFLPEAGGTLKRSINSLSSPLAAPAAIQRKKEQNRKKSQSIQDDESSISSVMSDDTIKAEPIIKKPPPNPVVATAPISKYIKNHQKKSDPGKNDTLTYRRQRRVGVHFHQSIRFKNTSAESSDV